MSKKKIGFVIASLSHGGAERVISNLSNELIEKFEVIIITYHKSTPFYALDNRIKVISCTDIIQTPTSAFQSVKLNYILTKQIFRILKAERINLIIGFITSANVLTTIAAKAYGIPCIISERNNPLNGVAPKFWVVLKKFIYPLSDHLVLQTHGVKKIFEKKINSNKISIIPNPITSDFIGLRDDTVKKEKIILTVGRLDENKNQKDIIEAFRSINVLDWKLLIIGDGDKKEALNDLINSYGLNDRVKIISKVKDIDTYYNKASIFVFTSKTEGFPNVLLEAMHFGLPCISTDCDFGPSDLIDDGVNGYLVPINQESILRDRLVQLINDPLLRLEFSKKAKLSTEIFHSKKVVAKWERLINTFI